MTPPCPSGPQLDRLLAEKLPEPDYDAIAKHVEHCPVCQAVLEERTRGLLPPARRPEPPRPMLNGEAGDVLPTTDYTPHAPGPSAPQDCQGTAPADPLATTD